MKIGLYAEHAGLIDLLATLWEDHDVRLSPRWDAFRDRGQTPWQGDEDIIVTTLPYRAESMRTGKPTIVYYTDPTFPENQFDVQGLANEGKVTVIGAEDCYPDDLFVSGVTQFIPFAIKRDKYLPYLGYKPQVAVVNQKPRERWDQVVRGATGVGMSLEELFGDIPFVIVDEDDVTRFRRNYTDSRVLFYFSNSPYTIVMWEAMLVGMPIVAWDWHHRAKQSVIHKYLHQYSIDPVQIRLWLREHLAAKATPVTYPMLPKFEEVQDLWNKQFDAMI